MKKFYTTLVAVLAITQFSYAQPYLPLTGGTLTGGLTINGGYLVFQGSGLNTFASGSSAVVIGSGSGTDHINYVYGNNPFAIWTNNINRFIIDGGGNVGIGTASPLSGGGAASWLTLNGTTGYSGGNIYSISGVAKGYSYVDNDGLLTQQAVSGQKFVVNDVTTAMSISTSGSVGIGTTNPFARLHVQNDANTGTIAIGNSVYPGLITSSSATGEFRIDNRSSATGGYISFYPNGQNTTVGSEAMRIATNGNVGIGTASSDAKLAVNGTIHTKEVKVDLTGWPDYVFKPKYKLPSLTDVKNYIDKNQHLPEMPSEQGVVKNGINLGEIVKIQTKKIEELTLYLIEQQKQINQLKQQLNIVTKALNKN